MLTSAKIRFKYPLVFSHFVVGGVFFIVCIYYYYFFFPFFFVSFFFFFFPSLCSPDDSMSEISCFPFIVLEQSIENGQGVVRVFDQQQINVKSDWKVTEPTNSLFPNAAVAPPNLIQCIRKFDAYVFTQFVQKNKSFCFVTDGPDDLLYTLRKECMMKGIRLAAYFDRFFDLCKEFNKFFPEYGAKSMSEMCQCLGVSRKVEASGIDNCKSIANMVASLLREGCAFMEPEVIPVTFDPFAPFLLIPEQPAATQNIRTPLSYKGAVASGGQRPVSASPVSSGESAGNNGGATPSGNSGANAAGASASAGAASGGIGNASGGGTSGSSGGSGSGNNAAESTVVRLRGLPWDASDENLELFFQGLKIQEVVWTFTHRNRPSGEAFVIFKTPEDGAKGLLLHKQILGKRYIEVFSSNLNSAETAKELAKEARLSHSNSNSTNTNNGNGNSNNSVPAQGEKKKPVEGETLVMMYGLPYTVTVDEIEEFFSGYNFIPGSVEIDTDASGKAVGTGQINFTKPKEALRAINDRNRKFIGKRYVNLHQNFLKKKQQQAQLMEQSKK